METNSLKKQVKANKTLLSNFSYMSLLQVFTLLTPLMTYPYLTRVLGKELYGLVITAQILASYAMIVVRFGFDSVSARHVSIWREDKRKISEILSSILTIRVALFVVSLIVYGIIVIAVPEYRDHFWLFIFSYGITLNVLLFPQFFFQGIERMKFITYINVIIQMIFVLLIFCIIKAPSDYLWVPILHAIGYSMGGGLSLLIIFRKYNILYTIPSLKQISYYFKDALPLFATDAVCTIKDKLNYLILGITVGMSDVVIYDVGSKLTYIAIQPLTIINTVVFPRMAKSKNNKMVLKFGGIILMTVLILVILINLFLGYIVRFLIGEDINLFPIRLFLLSPIFLCLGSYIGSSLIVARGYNKYMFYSILITTSAYLLLLFLMMLSGKLNTVISFIYLTVISYLVEMIYRIYIGFTIMNKRMVNN